MKKLIFLIILFLIPSFGNSQVNIGVFDDYLYFVNQNRPLYDDIEGTPYLSDDFVPVRVNDNQKVVDVKFNVFANNIEFKQSNGEVAILSTDGDYNFKMLDGLKTEFEIHSYSNDKGEKDRTFFKKIRTGENFTLFLKENVKLIPKKIATSGFEQNQPARFSMSKSTFYVGKFKEGFGELSAVPLRKKEISIYFKDRSKAIHQFIKKRKLKLDNEEDLVELFNFYWSED